MTRKKIGTRASSVVQERNAPAFEIPNPKLEITGRTSSRRVRQEAGLWLKNEQRVRPINKRFLARIVRRLLNDLLRVEDHDLAIHLIGEKKMTELNETILYHAGTTDVITFDYSIESPALLAGEIFVCVDEALLQAERFRTTWQSELVRYIVHGVLHLLGHDDLKAAARAKMKREENRLVRELGQEFDLRKLGVKTRVTG
ncbi:MAG TPA: rRNA maturation RNase YbeY [Verrucomicrobiae bacterium]|nr:rRNA maturation RNase YbeY [Verrucomicrobiae bacterium]